MCQKQAKELKRWTDVEQEVLNPRFLKLRCTNLRWILILTMTPGGEACEKSLVAKIECCFAGYFCERFNDLDSLITILIFRKKIDHCSIPISCQIIDIKGGEIELHFVKQRANFVIL